MDGRAVRSQSPRTAALSIAFWIMSWGALFWATPAAFVCSLSAGLLAVWLGWIAYRSGASGIRTDNFRSALHSAAGGASGLVTALLAVLLWVSVWPEVSARHARESHAHSVLATCASQTN